MTSIQSIQNLRMMPETTKAQDPNLPQNIQTDLQDLEKALEELKNNPNLAYDRNFQQKMEDYLNNYTADYNDDVKDGSLTQAQQSELSDLNEDLKVNGLIRVDSDGTIENPNNLQSLQTVMLNLLKSGDGADWIQMIDDAIDAALGKTSE